MVPLESGSPNLAELDVEEVLEEEYLGDYTGKLASLFIDIGRIETNLHYVRQILGFSWFNPFGSDPKSVFFGSYAENAIDINTVTITKLTTPTGSNSLFRFR